MTDPDFPQTIAEWLADKLPDTLSDDREWSVEVEIDPVAAGQRDVGDILDALASHTTQHGWDYAICLTDLPLRRERRPVLAEVNRDQRVAVMALPALGGVQPGRRARQLITQVLAELTAAGEPVENDPGSSKRGLQSKLTRLLAPIHRQDLSSSQSRADVRYHATRGRGRARLLTGMVRTNRPWRLIFGLSSALAAAVATSAFGLSSSTIWQIAYELGPLHEIIAAVVGIGVLVAWLIGAHHLWENESTGTAKDREQARLYNLSTIATLTIGVTLLYVGLFAINLAIAAFLVPMSLISTLISSTAAASTTYIALAWGFTTMGIIAGALGSSLESDQAVRQAAYGYREQQRRAESARVHASSSAHQQAQEDAQDDADDDAQDDAREAAEDDYSHQHTKDVLYAAAQRQDIPGRSNMSKQQLLDALHNNTPTNATARKGQPTPD